MSLMYALWDVIGDPLYSLQHCQEHLGLIPTCFSDDTITRKVKTSDGNMFSEICGCCPAQGNPLSRWIPRRVRTLIVLLAPPLSR
jgi:hypothetical protein